MVEENISQEFRLKNIDETRNYPKKVCATLKHIKHFVILADTISGCISVSDFASFLGIPIGITSSAIGFKICGITAGIKKYKSIIKRKEKET